MADPSFTALQLMAVGTLSQRYGWDFYRKLRANDTGKVLRRVLRTELA